jgi:hypothetical protein
VHGKKSAGEFDSQRGELTHGKGGEGRAGEGKTEFKKGKQDAPKNGSEARAGFFSAVGGLAFDEFRDDAGFRPGEDVAEGGRTAEPGEGMREDGSFDL